MLEAEPRELLPGGSVTAKEVGVRGPRAARIPARGSAVWATLVVLAVAAAVLLLTGVRVAELLLFVGYEAVFVLLPGMLLHALATRWSRRPWLERFVVGYALGLALELAAFAATAALDVRAWFPAFALPVYMVAALVFVRRRGDPSKRSEPTPPRNGRTWAYAGIAVVTLVYLAFGFFVSNPLARTVDSVAYSQDLVFHVALAAEAKHHWPIQDSSVAGDSMRYHTFANQDMAGISQATGIPLDVLLLRLWPLAMLAAIGGGIVLITRRIGGSANAAVLAAGLALLAGELDVDTKGSAPFLGGSLLVRLESPSFLLGAVFFLAGLYVLLLYLDLPGDRRTNGNTADRARYGWRLPAVLAVLLAGASGAKASILPVLIGGMVIFAIADRAVRRGGRPGTFSVLAMMGIVFVVSYYVLYSGGSNAGFELKPLHYGRVTAQGFSPTVASGVGELGLLALLAPLAGIVGVVTTRGWRIGATNALLVSMFVASLIAFTVLAQPGVSEEYFLLYGYLAAIPLSALGASEAWKRLPAPRSQWLNPLGLSALVVLLAAAVAALVVGETSFLKPVPALVAAYFVLAVVLAVAAIVAVRRGDGTARLRIWTGIAIPLVFLVSALDYPIDTGSQLASRWGDGEHAWHESVPGAENGMTQDLRKGLLWVRDNTPDSAVLAVNNVYTFPGAARYFYYGAFAERRTYIEGWEYSSRGSVVLNGRPLPPELVLRAQTSWAAAVGVPQALDALKRAGVDYLVVDTLNGQYANVAAVERLLKPRYSNEAVSIFDLSDRLQANEK